MGHPSPAANIVFSKFPSKQEIRDYPAKVRGFDKSIFDATSNPLSSLLSHFVFCLTYKQEEDMRKNLSREKNQDLREFFLLPISHANWPWRIFWDSPVKHFHKNENCSNCVLMIVFFFLLLYISFTFLVFSFTFAYFERCLVLALGTLKYDHTKQLITLTSDYIKRLSL